LKKALSYKIARIISTLFGPPSFTIIIFTYLALTQEQELNKIIITILTAVIFGFTLPIILFLFFRNKGKLIDLDASIKEERTVPFLISLVFYSLGILILMAARVNILLIAFWFCYITNTIIVVLINRHWKISVHSIGASGALAALIFVTGPAGLFFSLIVFLVGWSRIKLKCHNIFQVAAGIIFGFVSTYLQIYLILKWFNC
jgi:membrane-associated phospholipid phosphatase